MDLDYASWLEELKGIDVENDDGLKSLIRNPEVDYSKEKRSKRFFLNNIAVLNVDENDGSCYYDFVFPRKYDIVMDIKSFNPLVRLSITIGAQPLENPTDPILLIAAQYHEVIVRMSFDKNNIHDIGEFGFDYNALYFQHKHRMELAKSCWIVEERCKYMSGLTGMIRSQ